MRQLPFGEQHGGESNHGDDADTEQESAEGNADFETRLHSQRLTFQKNPHDASDAISEVRYTAANASPDRLQLRQHEYAAAHR